MLQYITVLFKKHKKHLPKRLHGTWVGELCRYGFMILLSAWILQGIRIMNWRETIIKIGLDTILTLVLFIIGLPWWVAIIMAHTLNFAFNGQLYAMYTHMGATHVTAKHFFDTTINIANKCQSKKSLIAAIAYGSLSRGCFKSTSDIDLRLIPANGECNAWSASFFALWLRCKAFIQHYPLDLYVYSPEVVVKRMRTDELPIMLYEQGDSMKKRYPERVELDSFINIFTRSNL